MRDETWRDAGLNRGNKGGVEAEGLGHELNVLSLNCNVAMFLCNVAGRLLKRRRRIEMWQRSCFG
jgi:hypothetical protein